MQAHFSSWTFITLDVMLLFVSLFMAKEVKGERTTSLHLVGSVKITLRFATQKCAFSAGSFVFRKCCHSQKFLLC